MATAEENLSDVTQEQNCCVSIVVTDEHIYQSFIHVTFTHFMSFNSNEIDASNIS